MSHRFRDLVIKYSSRVVGVVIFLMPFHAFLTVTTAGAIGHYTLLRLWKEILLTLLVTAAIYLVITNKKLLSKFMSSWLVRAILAYLALIVVCASIELIQGITAAKAIWYGALVDSRFLIFFLVSLVAASHDEWLKKNWQKLLFIPATLVAAFAVAQYLVLPYDFLKHLGYGLATIEPYETINNNVEHIRVFSTLRGANPLGAYLVLPIAALALLFVKEKKDRRDKAMFGVGLVLALVFSFSRSAWIGAVIAVGSAVCLAGSKKLKKYLMIATALMVVIGALGVITLRQNDTFENVFLHAEGGTAARVSSNDGHLVAFNSAASDIMHHPLGSGIGTAGPQSVYNNGNVRLAENYYLQIGQELGLVGMVLFIVIICLIGQQLWIGRKDPLTIALLVSLVGLSATNLFLHAWADDTLAYVWWGLAGIALSPAILKTKEYKRNDKKQ